MANEPYGARRRGVALAFGLTLATGTGCFGDWVNAVPPPRREAPPSEAPAEPEPAPAPPAEPCRAYLAEVGRRCDTVLDGRLGEGRCHAEIVRVMTVFRRKLEPPSDRTRAIDQAQACTQNLRVMPAVETSRRETPTLGPSCRRWAELLRERCVEPLSRIPPGLGRCGSSLLAFESMLGGITFGRAEDYESQCEGAAKRLHQSEAKPAGSSG